MKLLPQILILMNIVSLPDIIKGGGTTEERRRAATVSALRHQDLPPQLLRLIASNGHVTRDSEELESGFFPQNEWKALKRVFKRNERTAAIRNVIGLYDNAREAWENAPNSPNWDDRDRDDQFRWWKEAHYFRIMIRWQTCVSTPASRDSPPHLHVHLDAMHIHLNEGHEIVRLRCTGFDGNDIGSLSYLPLNLINFGIDHGDMTNFEFSKVPKGLTSLTLPGPDAESKLHVQSLPPGLMTLHLRQYGDRRKEDPLKVHFHLPLPRRLQVYVPRMDGLVFHPEPTEINEIEARWEIKWNDGSRIRVIVG